MNRSQRIETLLQSTLTPEHLDVKNESHQHHVPEGSETHFHITVVSTTFQNQSKIQRSRTLHHLLQPELNTGLHALSLHLYTPEEWKKIQSPPPSPACKGGFDGQK